MISIPTIRSRPLGALPAGSSVLEARGPLPRRLARRRRQGLLSVHPALALPGLPDALVRRAALRGGVEPAAVLLPIDPLAVVLGAVRPDEHAVPVLLVVLVPPLVLAAVGPGVPTRPVHQVLDPLA